jgi:arylsulfatase A-like enzyme
MTKLNRRDFLGTIGAGAAAATLPGCSGALTRLMTGSEQKLNFVFILIDDLGWIDTACYGSEFYETPNIDRLAGEGMRFTDAYAASPVCSPTRASILTGKYPARLNLTDWIGGSQRGEMLPAEYVHQMPLEEVTIAEAFRQAGYSTCFIGKWHLGSKSYYPEHQGFDVNIGGHDAGQPSSYFYPYKSEDERRSYWDVPGLEGGREGEYLTDRLTDEALGFMEENGGQPFLLYLSHYAVHTPVQSKEELSEKYRRKASDLPFTEGLTHRNEQDYGTTKLVQDNPAYAGMIESVDDSVGRILDKLDELDLVQKTAVIFMSDNGGLSTLARSRNSPTSNVPLRAGKGWLYEGGIREPMIIKWPGVVAAGGICSEPVISTDFYPTMLEMADLDLMPEQHVDGRSLVSLLKQTGSVGREAIFWHFPHYHGSGNRPSGAVRVGDYKLVEWFEDGRIELYNLNEDMREENDLAAAMPLKAEELKERLHRWRTSVDARMPEKDPGGG